MNLTSVGYVEELDTTVPPIQTGDKINHELFVLVTVIVMVIIAL